MIHISDLLTPETTYYGLQEANKKQVLEFSSRLAAKNYKEINEDELLHLLTSREKLGSTAIGEGVAIPHARLPNLTKPIGTLILAPNGIDFDSADHRPVDIIFTLVVPEHATQEHLSILSNLADIFNHKTFRDHLHKARDSYSLFRKATNYFT